MCPHEQWGFEPVRTFYEQEGRGQFLRVYADVFVDEFVRVV